MTLKSYKIYNLPDMAKIATVPGKIITRENVKAQSANIEVSNTLERNM